MKKEQLRIIESVGVLLYTQQFSSFCFKLGETNPKISDAEIEKLYVQANHFALVG